MTGPNDQLARDRDAVRRVYPTSTAVFRFGGYWIDWGPYPRKYLNLTGHDTEAAAWADAARRINKTDDPGG